MAAEVILRDLSRAQKEQINGKMQISYNSDGRLVIRYIQTNEVDKLIVFDRQDTGLLMNFIKYKINW